MKFKIIQLFLLIGLINNVDCSFDKRYKIAPQKLTILQHDIAIVPSLAHLCSQVIYKDWNKRIDKNIDTIFSQLAQNRFDKFKEIVSYQASILSRPEIMNSMTLPLVSIFDVKNKNNKTIINIILEKDNAQALHIALEHDLDLYQCDENHQTLLHQATMNGADDCAQVLLTYEKNGMNEDERAIERHHRQLLINMCDTKNGFSALHYAASKNKVDVCKYLVAFGANVELQNKGGNTPLHLALKAQCDEIVEQLIPLIIDGEKKNNKGESYIQMISNDEQLRLLLPRIKNINVQNSVGNALLHFVCSCKYDDAVAILDLLLEHPDIQINLRNKKGNTALKQAVCYKDNSCIIQKLLNAGADIHICDRKGENAVYTAIKRKGYEDAISLINHTKDFTPLMKKDVSGETLIEYMHKSVDPCEVIDLSLRNYLYCCFQQGWNSLNQQAYDAAENQDRELLQGIIEYQQTFKDKDLLKSLECQSIMDIVGYTDLSLDDATEQIVQDFATLKR